MKQEFVQLAHIFDPEKHCIAGAYISEKLDGERAIWDGGISRGIDVDKVPYANIIKDTKIKIATGLWSRTGKVINAPNWFLDVLPSFPVDGELYAGRKNWQQLSSTVSREEPDDRWRLIDYMVFDAPSYYELMKPRTISVRNDYEFEVRAHALDWAMHLAKSFNIKTNWPYELRLKFLDKYLTGALLVKQYELPFNIIEANEKVEEFAKRVIDAGGEGVVIRRRNAYWVSERSWDLLKYKPWSDDEGIVIGYYAGKRTDKGSKLLGLMGALELEWQGARFKISGFTDTERRFENHAMRRWAEEHPGACCPEWIINKTFPVGSEITFKYRELSDDGIPKEARFHRVKRPL